MEFDKVAPDLLRNAHAVEGDTGISDAEVRKTGRSRGQQRWMPIVSRRG